MKSIMGICSKCTKHRALNSQTLECLDCELARLIRERTPKSQKEIDWAIESGEGVENLPGIITA